METTDSITKQFVEGFGITEHEDGTQTAEPIRAMTAEEIKEREVMNAANTSGAMRARVLAHKQLTNGHTPLEVQITNMHRKVKDQPQA